MKIYKVVFDELVTDDENENEITLGEIIFDNSNDARDYYNRIIGNKMFVAVSLLELESDNGIFSKVNIIDQYSNGKSYYYST